MADVAERLSATFDGTALLLPVARRWRVGADQPFVTAVGGKVVRTIGIARARAKIGMTNPAYNMNRYVWLKQATTDAIA